MADLELEHTTSNTAEQRTWLIATPHDLGPDQLADFVGEFILEVKPGTSLVNSPDSNFGGFFARGSQRGIGVVGHGTNNAGVWGRATNSTGVVGDGSANGPGVLGRNNNGPGVIGDGGKTGVQGRTGLRGPSGTGVIGESVKGGTGVEGFSVGGIGVRGISNSSAESAPPAVIGLSTDGFGVDGHSNTSIGVRGRSLSPDPSGSPAIFGENSAGGPAGIFNGRVEVKGDLTVANGNKPFKIDHPLDPQNKYLLHNAVEAPERKNVYDGLAQLDEDGTASVDLPEWFEALNGDFRYQLTAVGGVAPNLHVAEEISGNRFKIAGGEGGMKICWQVTGTRKDPWAAANPFEVEQEKPQMDRGRYLQPDLYDAPEEQRVMIVPDEEKLWQGMPPSFEPRQAPEVPPSFEQPTAPASAPDTT